MPRKTGTPAAPPAAVAAQGGRLAFLTFRVGETLCALPMADVREVVRRLSLVPVPLAPPSLDGLVNLRGRVAPVIAARRLLGLADAAPGGQARMIVLTAPAPVALAVDAVLAMVEGAAEPLPESAELDAAIPREILRGVLKTDAGVAPVLDPERLLDVAFAGIERGAAAGGVLAAPAATARAAAAPAQVLISFDVAGQEFAIPIDGVREIIRMPEGAVRLPHAVEHMIGLAAVREELLPLVSLAGVLGLGGAVPDDPRVVVAVLDGAAVGLVVDRPRAVLRVAPERLAPVPALMVRSDAPDEITAIARLDEDRRLVSVLATGRLFRHRSVRKALEHQAEEADIMPDREPAQAAGEEPFVVFSLAGADYAVGAAAVEEVMRMPDSLTRVPKSAGFVEGVTNRRGGALPIVDMRRRFELPTTTASDRRRILVLRLGGIAAGFVVDAASRVVKVAAERVGPAPDLSPEQARLFPRILDLDGKMVLVLDPAALMSRGEAGALAELARGRAGHER